VKRRLRSVPEPPAGVFVLYRSRADEPFRAFARCADVAEAMALEPAVRAYETTIAAAAALPAGKAEVYDRQLAERKAAAVR
jgi:hypothetical protein